MATGYFDPYNANRSYSPVMSPGLSVGNGSSPWNMVANIFAQQGIFPRPMGNSSVYDMMMLRSRNMDYHYIMQRSLAQSQLAARMGGIDSHSTAYQMLYPMMANPDGAFMRGMAPFIGGNPVRAQMGLYADFTGQTMGMAGRIGSVTAAETTQMMDALQGKFYRPADFGRYKQSVAPSLMRAMGRGRYSALGDTWDASGLSTLEGYGFTGINRDLGNLATTTAERLAKGGDTAKIKEESLLAAQTMINTISNPATQSKMAAEFSKLFSSSDAKAAAKKFGETFAATGQDVFRQFARGVDFASGKVPGGINYNFTRGFNLEDITGAFGMATMSGLTGRSNGLDINKFAGSSVRVLDAARGLFGNNLSGQQLTSSLNDLIGTGSVNMTDEGEARKFEELLRNVKSAAKVAGVSIESMMGIIAEARGLAAQNPNLALGISGIHAMGLATSGMDRTSAAMSYMSPAYIRMMGGPVGITSAATASAVNGAGEPISQSLAALYFHAHSTGNTAAAAAIRNYSQSGDATSLGLNRFMQRVAPSLGMSPLAAQTFGAYNPLLAARGLNLAPELGDAGVNSMIGTMFFEGDTQNGLAMGFTKMAFTAALDPRYLAMSDEQVVSEIKRAVPRASVGEIRSRILPAVRLARRSRASGEGTLDVAQVQGAMGLIDRKGYFQRVSQGGLDSNVQALVNPEFRGILNKYSGLRASSTKAESWYAERMGAVNAPIMQRLFQDVLSGKTGEIGIRSVMDAISGGPLALAMQSATTPLNSEDIRFRGLLGEKTGEAGWLLTKANALASGSSQEGTLNELFQGGQIKQLMAFGGGVDVATLRAIGVSDNDAVAMDIAKKALANPLAFGGGKAAGSAGDLVSSARLLAKLDPTHSLSKLSIGGLAGSYSRVLANKGKDMALYGGIRSHIGQNSWDSMMAQARASGVAGQFDQLRESLNMGRGNLDTIHDMMGDEATKKRLSEMLGKKGFGLLEKFTNSFGEETKQYRDSGGAADPMDKLSNLIPDIIAAINGLTESVKGAGSLN